MLFLVVPTRGDHPALLQELVANSMLPRSQIVVVQTAKDAFVPEGCQTLEDLGDINIQRWWNRGIRAAIRDGATCVAVANDDLQISPGTLQILQEGLTNTGASIASTGRAERLWKSRWASSRRLNGALWVVNVAHLVLPNEQFRWAYGDDDLDIRARRVANGLLTLPLDVRNVHHNEASSRSDILQELSRRDRLTFRRTHPCIAAIRLPRHAIGILWRSLKQLV